VKPGPSLAISSPAAPGLLQSGHPIEGGLRVLQIGLIGPSVQDGFLLGEPLLGERAHFLSDAGQQEACSDKGADGGEKKERRAPQ
jgi:hypothetical protein